MAKRLTPEQRAEREQAENDAKLKRSNERKEATAKREKEKAEKRDQEKKERQELREKARAEKEEAAKAERAKANEDRARLREQSRKDAKERAEEEKAARKDKRDKARAEREAEIAKRAAETKGEGRRPKATHFSYTGSGLSKPQALSIRGQVLEAIVENCEIGEKYSIEDFGDLVKPILFGTNVRSYLSKLEELKHIDFHTM